jgi:hypothetical protein
MSSGGSTNFGREKWSFVSVTRGGDNNVHLLLASIHELDPSSHHLFYAGEFLEMPAADESAVAVVVGWRVYAISA